MDLKSKKVLVFGAGKSGIGAADLLGSVGAQPVIYDGNADLDKEIIVETDSELLTLIWNNLISNALKFTDDGGTLTVSVDESNGKAVVTIRDNGCGMSQETGRRIFDKFYQGDTSRASQGNGLGLALVKKVIDIIGGEITVESKLGEGSTFSIGIYK